MFPRENVYEKICEILTFLVRIEYSEWFCLVSCLNRKSGIKRLEILHTKRL